MKLTDRVRLAALAAAMVAAACQAAPLRAALMDYEPFAYSGTALNGQNGGTGWNGGWFNTATTDNVLSNDGVSLAYPASFEAPLATPSTAGSRVSTGGLTANASSSRLLSQPVNLAQDGVTRYVSALFRKNAPNGGSPAVNTDNILLEFVDSSGNRRWGVGIVGNGDLPWLNANGSTSPATPVVAGETYFMVAKIVSSAAGMDTAYLKVFGSGYASQVPFAEPASWDATLTETTGANLDRIRIRIDPGNTGAAAGEVDEIRIADTWAAAVGVPEPATGVLGACALALVAERSRRKRTAA
jgi:hypothetical protein